MNTETNSTAPWFRELWEQVADHKAGDLYELVVSPWIEKARASVSEFAHFRQMARYDRKDEAFQFPIWNLYALSRVNDFLLLPFQGDETREWTGPQVTRDNYLRFFTEIGFRSFVAERFAPFRHEIVQVRRAEDDDAPIAVERTLWPGLMFGDMLFSRSGVVVSGGIKHVVKETAENSTLYFTYQRLDRKTNDLSMGWGHNSQWRTAFRRDYECAGRWFYNVDGKNSLSDAAAPAIGGELGRMIAAENLTPRERIELCRNRCFVVTKKNGDDLWPFDDCHEEAVDPVPSPDQL
jgi:hypothetical protein